MQVFLSHTGKDKDVVELVGVFLTKRGLTVWLDAWRMTPGDSLVEKIGEGIQASDRLVVFLTPESVESNWVRKEVATGIVMEVAEEKGLGSKFVIPALLIPCKIPILLRDKIYANFTNKAFDAACEELLAGILDQQRGPSNAKIENRVLRTHPVSPRSGGRYALVVEFGVRVSPTEGLHIGIDVGTIYTQVLEWFGPPGNPQVPPNTGGVFFDSAVRRDPSIYARKFSSPGVTSTRSFYLYFESDSPLKPGSVQFLDFYDRQP